MNQQFDERNLFSTVDFSQILKQYSNVTKSANNVLKRFFKWLDPVFVTLRHFKYNNKYHFCIYLKTLYDKIWNQTRHLTVKSTVHLCKVLIETVLPYLHCSVGSLYSKKLSIHYSKRL